MRSGKAFFGLNRLKVAILGFGLSGCSLLGLAANMTSEQIGALICISGYGPPLKASLEVDPQCAVKIITQ